MVSQLLWRRLRVWDTLGPHAPASSEDQSILERIYTIKGINCGRTEQSASEYMAPEAIRQEEQDRAAWYAPLTNQFDSKAQDDQVRVISVAEAGGPSRMIAVTCGEKYVLTTL